MRADVGGEKLHEGTFVVGCYCACGGEGGELVEDGGNVADGGGMIFAWFGGLRRLELVQHIRDRGKTFGVAWL